MLTDEKVDQVDDLLHQLKNDFITHALESRPIKLNGIYTMLLRNSKVL